MLTFGPDNEPLKLTLERNSMVLERTIKRAPKPEPAHAPHTPNPLVGLHPVVDWQGIFIPCMGVGPVGLVTIKTCQSHMRERGFILTTEMGDTGLTFDEHQRDKTVIATVTGPAAQADIQPGDVVTAINGKPVKASNASHIGELIFGKAGDTRRLVVRQNGRDATVNIVLAKKKS
jgi:hypothetical protein